MRILIVGLGSVGKKHLSAIRLVNADADVYALRSGLNHDKCLDVIDIHDINQINVGKFDFIIISNPTSEHKRYILSLARYGIPLFIEKPLHVSSDVIDIIELTDKYNIISYVACNLRFLNCLKYIKDSLPGKRLNEVNVYCGSFLPDWRPDKDFRKVYSSNPELGGGVHLDLIHELDYLYWFFGKPVKVSRTFKNQSSLKISAYDYCNFLLEYDGFCVNVILNYFRKDPKRTIEMVFEDETWLVDLLKNQVCCNSTIMYESDQQIYDTYFSQMRYFMTCIGKREKTMNSVYDAHEVLKICLG